MAEKYVLIKKPRTTNGINPKIENGKQVYKEIVLPYAAKALHQKYNEKLPEHLRFIIEDYTPPETNAGPVKTEYTIDPAVLAEAKAQEKKPEMVIPEPEKEAPAAEVKPAITPDPPKQTSKPLINEKV